MKFLRWFKIKYRLIVIFLLVSIIPIFIIGYFSFHIYSNSIVKKLNNSTEQSISLIRKNILGEIERYQYLCDSISINKIIQANLGGYFPIDNSPGNDIENVMKGVSYTPYIKNIRIVNENRDIVYDLGYDNISNEQVNKIIDDVNIKSPSDSWSYVKTFRNSDIIVVARKIRNYFDYTGTLGYLLLFIDEGLFSDVILSNVDLGTGSTLLLMTSDGNILSTSDPTLPLGISYHDSTLLPAINQNNFDKKRTFEHNFNDNEEMISYLPIEGMNCILVSKIPFSYIYSETTAIKETINFMVALVALMCLILIAALYRSIMNPIHNIVKTCIATSSGDLSVRIQDQTNDEIGFLSNNIDSMVNKIEQLMAQQKLHQKRKRTLELQMLQYQINPHFLFNTLNTLKWIAVINKVHVISNGIGALSDLLKSTIINKDEYISLREELDNLKNYFEIQKIRYADSFKVIYDLDESMLDHLVLKFILQPIAENSIIHGIDENTITITISCKNEYNCLIIDLIDDGKGFDSSNLELPSTKKLTGIGVHNVDERLKLSFGPEYGLTITSQIGSGTICRIKIPLDFDEKKDTLND